MELLSPPSLPLPLCGEGTTIINTNGKEMKVVVKEIFKSTAACDACRTRKRKCDGHSPCSYCVSKKKECVFATSKKRGPSCKKTKIEKAESQIPLVAAQYESHILDTLEGQSLNSTYGRFAKMLLPVQGDIMNPRTTAHRIQSYITLAYVARIGGLSSLAQKYISQARVLSGTIYDQTDVDSAATMMTFSLYWNLTGDFRLCRFYGELAFVMLQMIPTLQLQGRLGVLFTNLRLRTDYTLSRNKDQLSIEFRKAADAVGVNSLEDYISKIMLSLVAETLIVFRFNISALDPDMVDRKFGVFDNLSVSEEGRQRVLKCIKEIRSGIDLYSSTDKYMTMQLLFSIDCTLFQMIVELQSGHIQEGLTAALLLLHALRYLRENNVLGLINKQNILIMIGSSCKLLHHVGHTSLALQIFDYVLIICKQMEPDYNYLLANTEYALDGSPPTDPIFGLTADVRSDSPNLQSFPEFFNALLDSTLSSSLLDKNYSPATALSPFNPPSSSSSSSSPLLPLETSSPVPCPSPSPSPLALTPSPQSIVYSDPPSSSLPSFSPSQTFELSNTEAISFDSVDNNDLENILQQLQGENL